MPVRDRIERFKEQARNFFFEVMLSSHACPHCGQELRISGPAECSCRGGHRFDPTLIFQRSPCCDARLIHKTYHYHCSRCGGVVASRFLFDERVFDAAYFREMMRESRERARKRREEVRLFLAGSRSAELCLLEEPVLDPSLVRDLDDFVGTQGLNPSEVLSGVKSGFSMQKYREHILCALGGGNALFSEIEALIEDYRLDRVWRFVTLVFMQHEGEVELSQYGDQLMVRVCHEAHGERQGLPGTAQIAS